MDVAQSPDRLRTNAVVWLLIAISGAIMFARLATVESKRGSTAMLSANDRSRWSTIRALVDHNHYEIDNVIFQRNGRRDSDWYTIDLVKHRGRDGRQHYYSSKPTLLTTLFAAPYFVMNRISGISIVSRPFYVVRVSLAVLNVLPMILFLWLLARLCEILGASDRATWFVVAAAGFGTPLTTFAVTMNNHLPGAVFALVALWAILAAWRSDRPGTGWFVLAGLASMMAVACELPALSLFAIAALLLLLKSWRKWLVGFLPAAMCVLVGIVGTNYLAHGTWATAYTFRSDGPPVAHVPGFALDELAPGPVSPALREELDRVGVNVGAAAVIQQRPLDRGYAIWDPETEMKYVVQASGEGVEIREWRNWYEYEGSYWSSGKKQGVDRGEPSRLIYAFHALVGHHGIFSLTPIWLLSCFGAARWLHRGDHLRRGIALLTMVLTIACLVFFLGLRPIEDRNYGGVSCCFRWTVWLIPFWLVCLVPAIELSNERRWLWCLAVGLLATSVFSAFYNSDNPWSHPWIFDYWSHLGWIQY